MTRHEEGPALVGIDVGTQSVRAIAFDPAGRQLAAARRPTPARMIDGARGDYDPDALFDTVLACLAEVGAALRGWPVAGMAVASLGESCVVIDAAGKALAPSLVWFDRRTERVAEELAARIGGERGFAVTGCQLDFTFGLCKLAWMQREWPEAMAAARTVLSMADWIAFRLSGTAASDFTLASRTFYLDIHAGAWSAGMLEAAGLDPALPAPLAASGTALGPVRPEVLAATGIGGRPVVAAGGHDHIVGSYAVGIDRPGLVLDSLGTADALRLATPAALRDPALLAAGFVQTAVATPGRRLSSFGAGLNSCGGAIEWFRAMAGGVPHQALIAEAEAVPAGSRGALFLPHLAASPPPELDPAARGAFIGLTADASRGALYRAVLEGLAMQASRMLQAMLALPGAGLAEEIRAIGGNSRNLLLMRVKASAYGRTIVVVDELEATALGAALLGGVAGGLWPGLGEAVAGLDRRQQSVEPVAAWSAVYRGLEEEVFDRLQEVLRPASHALTVLADRTAGAAPAI